MNVFKMNDCDWWMARSKEEAARDYRTYMGDDSETWEHCRMLEPEEMKGLKFVEDDGTTRTFLEELQRRIVDGDGSQFFASTEF